MGPKQEYILALGRALRANNRTWTGPQLTAHLNAVVVTTNKRQPCLTEGRRTYPVIAATFRSVERARAADLADVAFAFVDCTGKPAWQPGED